MLNMLLAFILLGIIGVNYYSTYTLNKQLRILDERIFKTSLDVEILKTKLK
jgi:hypothetical protein